MRERDPKVDGDYSFIIYTTTEWCIVVQFDGLCFKDLGCLWKQGRKRTFLEAAMRISDTNFICSPTRNMREKTAT